MKSEFCRNCGFPLTKLQQLYCCENCNKEARLQFREESIAYLDEAEELFLLVRNLLPQSAGVVRNG